MPPRPKARSGLVEWKQEAVIVRGPYALVAQLDRASDFESEGREFESLRARQSPLLQLLDRPLLDEAPSVALAHRRQRNESAIFHELFYGECQPLDLRLYLFRLLAASRRAFARAVGIRRCRELQDGYPLSRN